MRSTPRPPADDGQARHSAEWYRDVLGEDPMRPGDQFLVMCDGGPRAARLETFPPRLEIEESGGVYVLVDDGPVYRWCYEFVSRL